MTGTFEGVGSLQFSPDNKHAQIVSGNIEVNSGLTTLAEFTTEGYYLVSQINFFYGESSNDRFKYQVDLNDITLANYFVFGPADTNGEHLISYPISLLIPPFTKCTLSAQNIENDNSRKQAVILSAKVKGPIEQTDLEAITDGSKWAK